MNRKTKAFTLIELLVVVAIILILAGLVIPAIYTMIRQGHKTQAATEAISLANAVKQYRTIYGQWPGQTQGAADAVATHEAILEALVDNPRGENILGVETNQMLDPWGREYIFLLDENGDGKVVVNKSYYGVNVNLSISNEVAAVLSLGPFLTDRNHWVASWKR